ncbi:hypothetical protein ALI144C_06160 [Actinosynnema sp. ALI-1.44]|uniref:arylamine N-acetyltransferase family protein n=1 Tax=Actinosynnema sp. ALI-1.44 TaxID=1933779 RepID=UPI00097C0A19|nr:arylamine N-acetyltransferase [Actinosynnema sp. ALI-1.44]ONI88615.1 hypothetical protein ALI144C_06160 [Actinosynnema sp. ALI-1.44]
MSRASGATTNYLGRIGCAQLTTPDPESLRTLQHRHLRAIPFENLNVLCGAPITTAARPVREKLVDQARGGLCFELNSAFAHLLADLGYHVALIEADIAFRGGFVDGIGHPLLLVTVASEQWLVDVGFGGLSYLEPLRWNATRPQRQHGQTFHIERVGDHRVIHREDAGGAVTPMFRTAAEPPERSWQDFDEAMEFHRTSPDSPFTRKLICSRATGDGQVVLAGGRLTVLRNGTTTETQLSADSPVYGAAVAWILHGIGDFTTAFDLGTTRSSTPSILDQQAS